MNWARSAEQYVPYDGHISSGVVRTKDRSLLAMMRLHGAAHELASKDERNGRSRSLNTLWRNVADDNVTAYSHFVRRKEDIDRPLPVFHNDFSSKYYDDYMAKVLNEVFQNSWLLSVVVSPRLVPVGSAKFKSETIKLLRRIGLGGRIIEADILQLEEILSQLSRGLADYDIERLRLREMPKVHWDFEPEMASEMAEALHTILTGQFEPKPLINGPLSEIVYTDQTIFERRIHRVLPPGCDDDRYDGPGTRWGVIFALRRYPKSTRPIIFDGVLRLPMELVMSQSAAFQSQAGSIARLTLKRDQMKAAGDPSRKDRRLLRRAGSEVGGGEVVRLVHHFSLAVYADNYYELVRNAGLARTELANTGAVVVPETAGNESSWWAQLPGNTSWRTRPAGASSRNWADLSHFGAYPRGSRRGRWGDALITFRTTAGTAYDYVPHVGVGEDVGMTALFGPVGTGKTVILGTLIAMYDRYLGENDVQFLFDKGQGLELLTRFMRGNYLSFRLGQPSGMAPLKRLANTPANRLFLVRFFRSLALQDGTGPFPPEDFARHARAVAAIMRKPVHLRSIAGMRQYLGWNDPRGLGPRIERWGRGEELGWLFDGEEDIIDLEGRITNKVRLVGFDLTPILQMPDLVEVAGAYLIYLISLITDGRRIVLSIDEAQFYVFHETIRDWLESILAGGRKDEIILNLCSQQPELLLKGSFGVMMVNQCKTKFALPNTKADEKIYREVMHFTAGEYFAVHEGMHPTSFQFLIHREDGSVIIDNDLSELPEQLAIISGRQISVRRAAELRETHGEDWHDEFIKEAAD